MAASKRSSRSKKSISARSTRSTPVQQPANSTSQTPTPDDDFPVVGIGASAGGLEAFTQLLQALPQDTGMAFVLVQHLDPAHASLLTEILTRTTPLAVHEVQDGMKIAPNCVYVIPPNTRMSFLQGQ